MQRKVVILGATGSIGTSALKVIKKFPERLKLVLATAHSNRRRLKKIESSFPETETILTEEKGWKEVFSWLQENEWDLILNAISGGNGLLPSFFAVQNFESKILALANKETLVASGRIFMEAVRKSKTTLIPVDSEHISLFLLLSGKNREEIEKIYLTASGGALYDHPDPLKATPNEALRHPTWKMGPKITVDSATLVNKAFEIAEAHHLFSIPFEKIEVVIHRQSQIHAILRTKGGTFQMMAFPTDMAYPIAWALNFPEYKDPFREDKDSAELQKDYFPHSLTFENIDHQKFPLFKLAMNILRKSQLHGAALVGLNDSLVENFLKGKLLLKDFIPEYEKLLKTGEKDLLESTSTKDPENWKTYLEIVNAWKRK